MSEPTDEVQVDAKRASRPLVVLGTVLAVLISSAIAFCCTCFPTGLITFEILGVPYLHQPTPEQSASNDRIFIFSCVVGAIWAFLVGWWVVLRFRKSWIEQ